MTALTDEITPEATPEDHPLWREYLSASKPDWSSCEIELFDIDGMNSAARGIFEALIAAEAELRVEIERLTRWRAEEGEKIRRQAKALTDLKAHCDRVERERDGLSRKVAAVQRSGDDLAYSELADLQIRVHNQRQELARLRTETDREAITAELTELRAERDALRAANASYQDALKRHGIYGSKGAEQ